MKNSRVRTAHRTGAKALLFGSITSTAAFFIFAFVAAIIASRLENPTASLGLYAFFAFIAGGALSGFATAKYKGEGGFGPAVLSALTFVLVILLIGLITTGGALPLVTVINLLCYLAVSALFAFFARKREPRHRRR